MVNHSLLKCVLVSITVMVASGIPDKISTCCKKVSREKITEPIVKFQIQRADPPCVAAVIFITEKAHYCTHVAAPWVRKTIAELRGRARSSTLKTVSSTPLSSSSTPSLLLSIITSTTSPPSSSTILPNSSSPPSFLSSFSTITVSEASSGTTDQ